MKFKVSSSLLSSRLQAISKVVGSKSTTPLLDCFLFNVEDGHLTITATDSETTMVTRLDLIECSGNALFALPAKGILEPLREISEQPIELELDDTTLAIKILYQNGQFNFMAYNGNEYPQYRPLGKVLGNFEISSSAFLKGLSSTIFATSDDELRPVMTCVVMDITSESLTFVASDTHKLVRLKNTAFHANKEEGDEENKHTLLIVPKKPAALLKSVLSKSDDLVRIVFDEKNAVFQLADYTIIGRLLEGRYPNYEAVIPKNNPYTITIDRLSFLNALKRVSICSDIANNLVKLDISNNQMCISAQSIDFSTSAEESVPCLYNDEAIKIGFKAVFLIDILANISTQDVILCLADSTRAGLILPSENEKDEDLLMLLMPMMINRN